MKQEIAIILCLFVCLFGCAQNVPITIDGKISSVEAATIQLAVGVVFSQNPETVIPAYGVSTALLAILSGTNESTTVSALDALVAKEADKLNLDPLTRQSFNDLVNLVKVQITDMLAAEGIANPSGALVLVKDVIQIVNNSAKARLDYFKTRAITTTK